ncbi:MULTISPECIES: DUF6402 family protein [Burkholderia]|uniref:DUF6402 family protein n=1 Tax=Burkholderia TaxID=32008 RepID=UPI001453EBB6|nr:MULTISPECIES: DUF6402 family protein [Burkholderia]VWM19226.1 hypothetical protein BLA6992_06966 [Burkholderia lata]
MADVKKVPYYKPQKGLFGSGLKEYQGSRGCIPLETQKGVSLDRLAPGEKPPPPLPKPAPKAPSIPGQGSASDPLPKTGQAMVKEPPEPPEAEVCEKPPPFDLQDVPIAMDKLGWKVSAKLARIWFASPAHTYNDDPTSHQPLNDGDVTLDWVLKFGNVRKKYEKLLSNDIYSERSVRTAIDITRTFIKNLFLDRHSTLSFNTS